MLVARTIHRVANETNVQLQGRAAGRAVDRSRVRERGIATTEETSRLRVRHLVIIDINKRHATDKATVRIHVRSCAEVDRIVSKAEASQLRLEHARLRECRIRVLRRFIGIVMVRARRLADGVL